jgi:tape measure domain-containing protein
LANAGTLFVKLGLSDKDFNDTLKRAENKMKRFGDRIGSLGNRITQGISLPFLAAGGAAVKMSADMEQAEVALTTLTGSTEKARKQIEAIKQMAAQSPFAFPELVDSTRKMLAYGFSIEQTIPMLKTLGDATSALGLGKEGIDRVVVALGQMKAKSVVSAEEMKQLTEAGIGAWDYLAKSIGVSTAEAMKMAEKRMIDGATGIKAILEVVANDPKFKDGMLKQSQTLAGIWSNFKDQFGFTLTDIGNQIVKSLDLKDRLNGLITTLKNLSDWFANLNPEVRSFAVNVALITAALGPLLIIIGKVSTGWAAMIGLMRMLPQMGLVKAIKDIGFAIAWVATGAGTATESLGFLKVAFTPFLAGSAIAVGLAGIAYLWWKIGEQARIAKMKISETSSENELMTKKTFLESEIRALLNKKQHSDKLTALQKQGLNISNNDPWTPQDQKDMENTQAELRKVWGLINKKNKSGADDYKLDLPKLFGGSGGGNQNPAVAKALGDIKTENLEAQIAITKNLDEQLKLRLKLLEEEKKKEIAEAQKAGVSTADIEKTYANKRKAIENEVAEQKREFANQWQQNALSSEEAITKGVEANASLQKQILKMQKDEAIRNAKEKGLSVENIEKDFANRSKAIDQNVEDQKRQFKQQWSNQLLQAQIANTQNIEEITKLQLQAQENDKNEEIRLAQEKGLSIETIEKTYAEKRKAIEKNLNEEKANYAREWQQKLLAIYRTNDQLREAERAEELRQASEKGFDTTAINQYYDLMGSNDFWTRWKMGLMDAERSFGSFGENVQKMAATTAETMRSTFDDFFFDAFTGKLQSLGDYLTQFFQSVLREITGMVSKMLTNNLMSRIFGGFLFGGGSVGGDLFLNHTGYAGGFASGGYISPNKYALVGERGPELIKVGSSGATVTPNYAIGGDVQVNIINQTGQPFKTRQEPVHFNGKTMVKNIILELAATDLGFREAMKLSR